MQGPGESSPLPRAPRSRRQRMTHIAIWLAGIVLFLVLLEAIGVDVTGWISSFWDQVQAIPAGYLVAALIFQLAYTTLAGYSYYSILRYAYPGEVPMAPIITAYAVGVAMNGFLPANIGTFVTLVMFVAIIPSATLAGSIAAFLVQKIFFTLAGTFVFLYMFLSVPNSFNLTFSNLTAHPLLFVAILAGVAVLLVILGRIFWRQLKKLWVEAKQGGVILSQPKKYMEWAFLPSFLVLALQADRDRHLPGRVRDPGHVRLDHVGVRLGVARGHDVVHARRHRRHAGHERAGAEDVLRRPPQHCGRLLDGTAADHDGLERDLRADPRRAGLRLERREGAGRIVLRAGEGEGRRHEGRAEAQEGREEGGEASGQSMRGQSSTSDDNGRAGRCDTRPSQGARRRKRDGRDG